MTTEMIFDYLGIRLDAARAGDTRIVLNWNLPDVAESCVTSMEKGALIYTKGTRHATLMGERTRSFPEHEVVSCTQSPRPASI